MFRTYKLVKLTRLARFEGIGPSKEFPCILLQIITFI
jgi:hypothetical protein